MVEIGSSALRAIDPADLVPAPDERAALGAHEARGRFTRALLRPKRVRAALAVLALVYTAAIFAPLVANDRPYRIESVSHAEYGVALQSLRPITASLARLVVLGPAGHAAERTPSATAAATSSYERALNGERGALAERSVFLRAHASSDRALLFDRFDRALDRAVDLALAGDGSSARTAADEASALAERIRSECAAADPAHPEGGGMPLRMAVRYPLLESIRPWELFLMVVWTACLAAPWWWSRAGRGATPERRARVRVGVALAIAAFAAAAACAWGRAWGTYKALDASRYKTELASGRRAFASAVFAPHPMGYAETHPTEPYRPPTWAKSAEIAEDGLYVRGARAGRADGVLDLVRSARPVEVRFAEPARNSPWRHPFGTDSGGRDLFARCLWGARTSLSVGLLAAVCLCAVGTLLGALAGYCGGAVDAVISRAIEVVLCFPAFFLILAGSAVIDPDRVPPLFAVAAVIALVGWTGVARLVRAEFLKLRELEFVQAARALGFSHARTIFVHMLPHAMGPVLVALAFAVASGILTESALSFLGFGVREPIPSWGSILNDSHSAEHWWIQIFPGALIFLTVLAYNVLGEGVRDALDPRRAA